MMILQWSLRWCYVGDFSRVMVLLKPVMPYTPPPPSLGLKSTYLLYVYKETEDLDYSNSRFLQNGWTNQVETSREAHT